LICLFALLNNGRHEIDFAYVILESFDWYLGTYTVLSLSFTLRNFKSDIRWSIIRAANT
jgi:hypothetical protein